MKIPLVGVYENYLSMKEEIDNAIKNTINNDVFVNGKAVKEFEKNYAKFCNTKHAIGCSNGTSALHLALLALGIKNGDEVITVPNSFIATTEAVSHAGGKIKFVDVMEDTGLIDINALEKSISPSTKAIIVVNLYGQMPDMQRIKVLADDNDIRIIEDSAQAHGAEWNGHKSGYCSDIATYSFFPAKILGAFGDGGAVITNNNEYARRVRLLANHGRESKYEHLIEGYNYRLDTIQAAILNVKLGYLNSKINLRRHHALYYDTYLKADKIIEKEKALATYYMYVLKIPSNRQEFIKYMRNKKIATGVHYPVSLHLQPAYCGLHKGDFPVAEKLSEEIVSIPVYPELKYEQLEYIIKVINDFPN